MAFAFEKLSVCQKADRKNSFIIARGSAQECTPLLELVWRKQLYKGMPVPKNWHRDYAQGKVGVEPYQNWRGYKV